jgi:hypothetical protein
VLDVPGPIDMATVYVQPRHREGPLDEFERKRIPEIWLNPAPTTTTCCRGAAAAPQRDCGLQHHRRRQVARRLLSAAGAGLLYSRMSRLAWLAAALLISYGVPASAAAQWVYRSPTAPRTRAAPSILSAPRRAPRRARSTSPGSGRRLKFNANLAADLKPDEVPMRPVARALFQRAAGQSRQGDPEGFCLPPGFPRVNGCHSPPRSSRRRRSS